MASSFHPEKARVPPAVQTPATPITKFKIGLCQLKVTADKEKNIVDARSAIEEAAEKGAKLVVLPEIWNSPYSNASFPIYAEDIDAGFDASPSTAMLSEVARLLKITIIGGSIPNEVEINYIIRVASLDLMESWKLNIVRLVSIETIIFEVPKDGPIFRHEHLKRFVLSGFCGGASDRIELDYVSTPEERHAIEKTMQMFAPVEKTMQMFAPVTSNRGLFSIIADYDFDNSGVRSE